MAATIFVLDLTALMAEDVLKLHMAAALPERQEKAMLLRQNPDRARCIGAGILLAQAYDYYQKENRESAEADSFVVFTDRAGIVSPGGENVAGKAAAGTAGSELWGSGPKMAVENEKGEMHSLPCHIFSCDLSIVFETPLLSRLPRVLVGHKDKPYFENGPCFNLSHAGNLAACIMAPYPVGIDVERTRPCRDSVMKRCFAPEELARVHAAGGGIAADREFTAVWTKKEAQAKLSGNGIADIFGMGRGDGQGRAMRTIRLCEDYALTAAWDLPSE